MIILVYGKDTYRSKERLNQLREEYKTKNQSGINERFLDGKKLNFEDLKNEILGMSFFNEKKLIIIENAFSNKILKEEIKAKGKEFFDSENIILFYETEKLLKADILYAFIRKKAVIEEYDLLKGAELKKWIKKQVSNLDGKISDQAIEMLMQYIENDLWRQNNEIHKLVFYKNKAEITEKDIELLINTKTETNIFNTIDAIAENDKQKAIRLIQNHLDKGESIFGILALIASQFKNMMIVKTKNYKDANIHPFVARKAHYQSEKFSMQDLQRIYKLILDIDSGVKTGKVLEKDALQTLILEI